MKAINISGGLHRAKIVRKDQQLRQIESEINKDPMRINFSF